MKEGWVKTYRSLLDWEWHDSPITLSLFIHLLLEANHEEEHWHGITFGRGQIHTTQDKLAKLIGVSSMQLRTALDHLESTGEINKQRTNKYTTITICNYERYQAKEDAEKSQDNEQITDEQQTNNSITRNKEDKNIYNILSKDNIVDIPSDLPAPRDIYKEVQDLWNSQIISCPKVSKLTDARKRQIKTRVSEMGGWEKARNIIVDCINRINHSSFLSGLSGSWQASFDWLFKNDKNWVKVQEGNYDDKDVAKAVRQDGGSAVFDRYEADMEYIKQYFMEENNETGESCTDIPDEQ